MAGNTNPQRSIDAAGLAIVVAVHAAALGWLWSQRLIPTPAEATTLFVNFIAPPATRSEETPKPAPRPAAPPRPAERPQPRQLVAEAPVVSAAEPVAPPPPPPVPAIVAPAPIPEPAAPVTLDAELSVTCPDRTPPRYPTRSQLIGEEGTVILRVELDELGAVAAAQLATGSGHPRLDDAALAAVRSWHCAPARRNGRPVRAIALQPFKFILQGH